MTKSLKVSRQQYQSNTRGENRKSKFISSYKKYWQYYLLLLPALIWFVIFCYGPMYGVQIAFKNFIATKGIWGSEWVGFEHFIRFFQSYYFTELLKNTLVISIYGLIVGFPLPILLALGLNELKNGKFKRTVQTITYAPYFISIVVMCGMLIAFLSPSTGIVNKFIEALGGEPIAFISKEEWFPTIYVLSNVWQATGWGSIIYLAALAGVDLQLHEAATIDGATRLQRLIYINIPHIAPTMILLLILNAGNILSVGYEKIYLLQNSLNSSTSEVISTYVYKTGLISAQYSFSAAVGLLNSVVNLILLVSVNWISKKVSETSLW